MCSNPACVAYWRDIVLRFNSRDPGITVARWCEANHININTFYKWKRRIRAMDAEAANATDPAPADRSQADSAEAVPEHAPADPSESTFFDITSLIKAAPNDKNDLPVVSAPSADLFSNVRAPDIMIQRGEFLIYVGSSVRADLLRKVLKAVSDA